MGADPGRDPLAPYSLSAQELKNVLATERAGAPFLVYRDGAGALRLFVLEAGSEPVVIGRRDGVALQLTWDGKVSGIHAELVRIGGEWTVVDDGLSTNGTFLNARRVTGRQRLRDGDRLRVGLTVLAFNAAAQLPTPKTALGEDVVEAEQLTDSQRRVLVALCRPQLEDGGLHAPATNLQISTEVFLGVDAVKLQLRTLFARFGLEQLPQNQKRAALAEFALRHGLVSRRDL